MDTVVDVVLSLRVTGQHVLVPVHVRLPSIDQLTANGYSTPGTGGGFSWVHLLALALITLLVAVVG